MRYTAFRDLIQSALEREPDGLTWVELQRRLDLPYKQPCQTWVYQLEAEIGLRRDRRQGRALVWQIAPDANKPSVTR